MGPTFQVTFDCADPDRLARFWADALGYVFQPPPDGYDSWPAFLAAAGIPEEEWDSASAIVDPDGTRPRMFFQKVPEPKSTKNRVHLDLDAGGGLDLPVAERRPRIDAEVARLTAAGAREIARVEEHGGYHVVLADPEGNEFCVASSFGVTMDCSDPGGLAPFWADLLGYIAEAPPAGYGTWEEYLTELQVPREDWNAATVLVDPEGVRPRLYFQRVPEPKTVKNRVHFDVDVAGPRAQHVEERRDQVEVAAERLVGLGAVQVDRFEQHGEYWVVMADPAGNEFCLQ